MINLLLSTIIGSFIFFTVQPRDGNNRLSWAPDPNQSTKYYLVQSSGIDLEFATIDTMAVKSNDTCGSNLTIHVYNYTDKTRYTQDTIYYRIVTVTDAGRFYSSIAYVPNTDRVYELEYGDSYAKYAVLDMLYVDGMTETADFLDSDMCVLATAKMKIYYDNGVKRCSAVIQTNYITSGVYYFRTNMGSIFTYNK